MKDNTQICATIPKGLISDINEIADRDNRTFSQTVCILLQRAVKESNRKRKKDNTQHHSDDLGQSNRQ